MRKKAVTKLLAMALVGTTVACMPTTTAFAEEIEVQQEVTESNAVQTGTTEDAVAVTEEDDQDSETSDGKPEFTAKEATDMSGTVDMREYSRDATDYDVNASLSGDTTIVSSGQYTFCYPYPEKDSHNFAAQNLDLNGHDFTVTGKSWAAWVVNVSNASDSVITVEDESRLHLYNTEGTIGQINIDKSSLLHIYGNTGNVNVADYISSIHNDGALVVSFLDLQGYANVVDYLIGHGTHVTGNGVFLSSEDWFDMKKPLKPEELVESYLMLQAQSVSTLSDALTIPTLVSNEISAVQTKELEYNTKVVKDGYTQAQIDELEAYAIAAQQAEAAAIAAVVPSTVPAEIRALSAYVYNYYTDLGFTPIVADGSYTLRDLAKLYGVSVWELKRLNPYYAQVASTYAVVPAGYVLVLGANGAI